MTIIWKKLFTISGILFVLSVVSMLPVPGTHSSEISILTPGIAPLIIMQAVFALLSNAGTPLAKMDREKRRKLMFVSGMVLAVIQSFANAVGYDRKGLVDGNRGLFLAAVSMTTFSWLMMGFSRWLRPPGQGMTILLAASIFARFPSLMSSMSEVNLVIIVLIVVITIATVYFVDGYIPVGDERIPISPSGVMPAVFAFLLMELLQAGVGSVWKALNLPEGGFLKGPLSMCRILAYVALIIYFSFRLFPITFSTSAMAERLKKSGIPGMRPENGEEYIGNISRHIWNISRHAAAAGASILAGIAAVSMDVLEQFGDGSMSVSIIIISGMLVRLFGGQAGEKDGWKKAGVVWPRPRKAVMRTAAVLLAGAVLFLISVLGRTAGMWICGKLSTT